MSKKSKTPTKNLAPEGKSSRTRHLIGGGKRWSLEKKVAGQHITHYDGPKGFNVNAPNISKVPFEC